MNTLQTLQTNKKILKKGGDKSMKHKLIKYLLATIAIIFITIPTSFAVISVELNKVQAIYEYSDFSKTGGASKIYDPVNDKYTLIYKNATVSGYYGTDGRGFITEQVVTKDAAGVTRRIEDKINQRVMVYDNTGRMIEGYSYYDVNGDGKIDDNEKYEAKITYNSDGSYTVSWKGKIDKDGNPNTTEDQEIIDDATVQKYDAAGRMVEVVNKSWDNDKKQYTTASSKYIYDGAGNLVRVDTYSSEGKLIAQTYFDSLGRESYTMAYDPEGDYWYLASKNFYDGLKLVKTENYEQTDPGTTKLHSTVYYDQHGRISYVTDAMGREIQRYFYNDTTRPQTETVQYGDKTITVTANPGQVVKVENYTYSDKIGVATTMTTFFDQNKQKITVMGQFTVNDVDKYNNWLKQNAPNIPVAVDPTATGKLKFVDDGKGNGYVVLEITDKKAVENLTKALKEAKDKWGQGLDAFFDEVLKALGDTNCDGVLSDEEWEAKGGKVHLRVGAIDPKKLQQLGNQAAQGTSGNYGQTGGGHARRDLDSTAAWYDELMKQLINSAQNGETVTLTWTYWAIDSNGNIWIFAESKS